MMMKSNAFYGVIFPLLFALTTSVYGEVTPTPSPTPTSPAPVPSPPPLTMQQEKPEVLVLNLEGCLQRALASSPEIEAAEFEKEVAQSKYSQASNSYFLPDVNLRVLGGPVPNVPNGSGPEGNFPSVDTSFTDLGPFLKVRVEAIQPLFAFGKLSNLKKAAAHGVEARQAGESAARNLLAREVKVLYAGLTYLYSLQDFVRELLDRAGKAREQAQEKIKQHSAQVTEIDLMRLDVFDAEIRRRSVEVDNGIDQALKAMAVLTGVGSSQPIDIVDKEMKFREVHFQPVEEYLHMAEATRPELKQLSEAVAVRKALYESQRADYYPFFFLGGFYEYAKAPGREDVDNPFLVDEFNNNTGGGAIGLQQKLSFHMTHSRVEEEKAEYLKALAQQKAVWRGVELDIRNAYSKLITGRDSVEITRSGLKAGRSWVTATTLNFGIGLVPVKDLLEAFVAYTKVKASFLETVNDYDVALADLSRAVGREVMELRFR